MNRAARTVGVMTVGRSDYTILTPLLRRIQDDPDLNLYLMVSGMHLSPEFGLTVGMIEQDGFPLAERIEMSLCSDTPEGISKSIGLGVIGFAQAFARFRPEILVILGDRFEMYSAALAALPFKIPVAHIHGGELTQGAFDDALRHSITKLSHLHFPSTEEYGRRILQMGEEPWRVTVSGAPSLDNLQSMEWLSREDLECRCGFRLQSPPLLVTYHPVTLEYEQTEYQLRELLEALSGFDLPIIFTLPNADTHGRTIARMFRDFTQKHLSAWLVANLGTQAYFSLMAQAAAMVGNSSSGLIEAPSLGLPVVNIGNRQRGRVRAANVIDVGYASIEIQEAIRKALRPEFRVGLRGLANPYGDGHASEIVSNRLKEVTIDNKLLTKRFVDWATSPAEPEGRPSFLGARV